MKYYNKFLMVIAASAFLVSCADNFESDFTTDKPEDITRYEYLNVYDALKTYIDRNANPNFKLGAGVTVSNFLKKELEYSVATSNFDEVTAGNAMKYSSCVSDNGSMDFAQVAKFVDVARTGGLTIYGHTLAWHAQQNNKYLNGLIAGKPVEVGPGTEQEVEDAFEDYSTYTHFPYYVMDFIPEFIDGQMVSSNPEGKWIQHFVADNISTTPGTSYKVTALIQGSSEGSLNVQLGNWGALVESTLHFTTEWQEVSINFNPVSTTNSFIVFQPGTFKGDIRMKSLKVTHLEAPASSWWTNLVTNGDAEGDDVSCFYSTEQGIGGPKAVTIGAAGTGADGVGHAFVVQSGNAPEFSHSTQFFIKIPKYLVTGDKYQLTMKYKAAKAANSESQSHNNPGGYIHWQMLSPNPAFTTEWQEKTWIGSISESQAGDAGMNTIAFNLAVFGEANTYYFDDIKFEIEESGNTIPYTPEEKAEILTQAMERWVKGMMEACEGYVSVWDVVNEAISGRDVNGDGYYELQSAVQGTVSDEDIKNNFYWQDYLGDIEYVRTTVKFARQYYQEFGGNPADLKLFINDYNLESDWDDNKKLKSLINWITRWEEDGTVIDGIGTQMHVSYHANPATQESKERHIVKMYELMAATGKLVKVSELDMGYVDEAGNTVLTEHMTDEQHKAMAEFYTFIIKKYFEIIPVAQRYGITQWAPTDSPNTEYSWRKGEPIGLWDLNYNRKPAYGGFANGLAGKDVTKE